MTKSIDRPKYLNDIGIFQSKDAVHGRTRVSRPAILAKIFGQLVVFLHNFDSPQAKRHLTTSIVNFGTRVVSQVPKDCDCDFKIGWEQSLVASLLSDINFWKKLSKLR